MPGIFSATKIHRRLVMGSIKVEPFVDEQEIVEGHYTIKF